MEPTSVKRSPPALEKKYWVLRSRTLKQPDPQPAELKVLIEKAVSRLATTNCAPVVNDAGPLAPTLPRESVLKVVKVTDVVMIEYSLPPHPSHSVPVVIPINTLPIIQSTV